MRQIKANILLLICMLCMLHTLALIQSPPQIVKQPPTDELLFQVKQATNENDKPFVIECEAEGEPAPKYRWIKNGKHFDWQAYDDRISQQPGRGTLVITSPRDEDLGQYQCFAENEWGIATSNSVFVRKAELNSFKDSPPISIEATEGEPFHLTCQPPDGWPKPNVFWMIEHYDGQIKSINNSRMTLDPEGNLWFSNVTREDSSDNFKYACAATSVFRKEYKLGDKVLLNVIRTGVSASQNKHEPVLQYVTRKTEVALRGKKIELFCIFGGTPLPQIVWSKDGVIIKASDRLSQGNYGKSLIIKHVNFDDAGAYTCDASNGVGQAKSYSIKLNVMAIPFFTEEPEIINAAEDETATFHCEASGVPEPEIKWVHNGKPIDEAPPNPRRKVTSNSIVIEKLVKKDTGNYGCNATNSLGYVYKDVYVNVLALAPEITEPPRDEETVDSRTVVMTCRVFGAPKPEVKWLISGREVTGGRYTVEENGDLRIDNVAFSDTGEYKCYASNKFGTQEATGSLNVKEHTRITDEPEDYEVAAGTQATFRCNAVADPSLDLEILWLNNGEQIDFDSEPRFVRSSDYSLTISKTTELDSGVYTCVARTALDEAKAQATLIVQDVPNAPTLLSMECKSDSAAITWQSNGDNRAPILRYTIQYNTSFTPETWQVAVETVPSVDTKYSIAISPWGNYTFRVLAWNKIGASLPSSHSNVCPTQKDVPYKNPENVEGEGTEPNNLVIKWTPMPEIEHNAPRFMYRVMWKRDIAGERWNSEDVSDWNQNKLIIRDQPTFQKYLIKVVAINEMGEANVAAKEVVGYSGEAEPLQAPTNFTLMQVHTATTAMLQWNPVPPESVRGHFKGYKIQTWTERGGEQGLREIQVKMEATRALVSKFVPHAKNYARVLVYNGKYNGPPSEVLSFVTPEGVPGTVQAFEAFPMGSSALYLVWKKPERPNGDLTGYKIYYQVVKDTQVEAIREREPHIDDPKQTRCKLAGLEPNTKYRIHIRATTKPGEGEEYFIEQRTRGGLASKPDIPDFRWYRMPTDNGLANIKVVWLPNLEGKPGSMFYVKYKVKGKTLEEQTQPVLTEDHTEVRGLMPGEVYEFKVVSIDGDYSTESGPQEVDTYGIEGPIIQPKENVATAGWFIGMMLAIAFLLLVLIIVCIVKRNRGGKYAVHEREQANGRRDYPDEGGFHEYSQPLDNKSHGRASMSSEPKQNPESDTDSMAEYGEGDTDGDDVQWRQNKNQMQMPTKGRGCWQTLIRRVVLVLSMVSYVQSSSFGESKADRNEKDLTLWIDEQQVKMFSGLSMQIYAIVNGTVLPYILDPDFDKYLPIIPAEVGYVNFTWTAGTKNYRYNFNNLVSFDEAILKPPVISIKTRGRIPKKPKEFSVLLPCSGNVSGLAAFSISLEIKRKGGKLLPGTPLKLKLRKECAQRGPDPECDKKCANQGWCNHEKICQCREGYMGQYCRMALCYPQCMNGGNCTSPGICSCPTGFQGRHCEGGICAEKCLNGGKCIQKDTCECSKGYYGLRCEFSKCAVPCLNGGRCRGVNKCRCGAGFRGDHCEIGRRVPQRSACRRPCRHGTCRPDDTCLCDPGWYGRLCHQRMPHGARLPRR